MTERIQADIVVMGSGGAALSAALTAATNGSRVVVLERSDQIGGSTAVSGGALWVPGNHHMGDIGVEDSREEAMAYVGAMVGERGDQQLAERFVDTGHQVVRWLEESTPLTFSAWSHPDYRQELDGAKPGGRSIEPQPFEKARLGEWAESLRPSPILVVPVQLEESTVTYRVGAEPLPRELIQQRMEQGLVTCGNALIGGLLRGCLDQGVQLLTGARATELVTRDGAVVGVRGDWRGTDLVAEADAVVLASGGYEWSSELRRTFLVGDLSHPQSPPFNEGDALVMAMEVGADLANMSEAWWYPSGVVPGETYDGRQLSRQIGPERSLPHSIMVNRYGRRFVNEAANYNDMGKALSAQDATEYGYRNLPSWVVLDSQYRQRYRMLTLQPSDPDPEWLAGADSLDKLAAQVGIDADGLHETVQRFNGMVAEGRDRDFRRGESLYDRMNGDASRDQPNLGTIEQPPFYAIPVYVGCVGTKGGPRVDADGRVLDVRGQPIAGLYAAGNACGGFAGPAYFGGGTSIASGIVWGHLAARHATGVATG